MDNSDPAGRGEAADGRKPAPADVAVTYARRAIRVSELSDAEVALIMAARVPPEHDYDYLDDTPASPHAR